VGCIGCSEVAVRRSARCLLIHGRHVPAQLRDRVCASRPRRLHEGTDSELLATRLAIETAQRVSTSSNPEGPQAYKE